MCNIKNHDLVTMKKMSFNPPPPLNAQQEAAGRNWKNKLRKSGMDIVNPANESMVSMRSLENHDCSREG